MLIFNLDKEVRMQNTVSLLRSKYADAQDVWFFVKSNYRIMYFNKKAASNSLLFHNKKLAAGDSILDYARDTESNIDSEFITNFGKCAAGSVITEEKEIRFKDHLIFTRSTYTPIYDHDKLLGISILVEVITGSEQS